MSLARHPLQLTTPALGVRQWRDDRSGHTTRVAWASAGGRGLPVRVIFLPVLHDGARWAPPNDLMLELQYDPRSFWARSVGTAALRRELDRRLVGSADQDDVDDPGAPRSLVVADDCGARWGAHHVLVLLVYDEPPVIEPRDDPAAVAALHDAATLAVDREEVEALRRFFDRAHYDERLVVRGLVRLPGAVVVSDTVVFALASCQYPSDVTDGTPGDRGLPDPPASASLLRLWRLLTTPAPGAPAPETPSLLVLVGDQVYVDATAGLFDARSKDDRLRLPYQNLMRSPGAQAALGLLPVAMVLDDHEIRDNWEPGVLQDTGEPLVPDEGKEAYRRFQRMAGPPLRDVEALWCDFTHSGVPFFLADTRTERGGPSGAPRDVGNWRRARIMSDAQWGALGAFLMGHRDRVAFVASPSMLLPRMLGLTREPSLALEADSWDGFPASRDDLLALLCDNELSRVVFLSGDAHTSCVVQATVTDRAGRSATLWSVHSSGLYCPYPFANDTADTYACDEMFSFERPGAPPRRYRCRVERVDWAPGDGFATLAVTPPAGGPQVLSVRFHRAEGQDVCVEVDVAARTQTRRV